MNKQKQPRQPPGRPPSYPTVVTTPAATTTSSASALSPSSSSLLGGNSSSSAAALRNMSAVAVTSPTTSTSTTVAHSSQRPDTATITVEEAMRLYKRDGNAAAALEAFIYRDEQPLQQGVAATVAAALSSSPVVWQWHNRSVLEHILHSSNSGTKNENNNTNSDFDGLATSLSAMLSTHDTATPTDANKNNAEAIMATRYNHLVIIHNQCLCHYANGKYREALSGALTPFIAVTKSIKVDSNGMVEIIDLGSVGTANTTATSAVAGTSAVEKNNDVPSLGYLFMATRMAFLIMDCHLALHSGDGRGLGPITNKDQYDNNGDISIQMEDILLWIENNPLYVTSKKGNGSGGSGGGGGSVHYEWFQHDELKFRLHLYRSRMLFAGTSSSTTRDDDDGNDMNSRMRISRKELKNAMDIYQNKLSIVDEAEEEVVGKDESNRRGKISKHDGDSKGALGSSGFGQQDHSETTSVTSMAGGSFVTSSSDKIAIEAKGGMGMARATFEGIPNKSVAQKAQSSDPPIGSSAMTAKVKNTTPNLQAQHESVLYLKANLEYLRGNTSKSLKLCAEARSIGKKTRSVRDNYKEMERDHTYGAQQDHTSLNDAMEWDRNDDSEARRKCDYDDAIYYNNLALLHQSAGKMYLALQYYSYALSYMQQSLDGLPSTAASPRRNCWSNGMVCPDLTAEILNNKSLCAFHAQEFLTAYTCMAQCVKHSPCVFGKRARCWLRLAQSCIGIHTKMPQVADTAGSEKVNEIFLTSIELGSDEDLSTVSTHPLKRASHFLYMTLHLSAGNSQVDSKMICTNEIPPLPKEGAVDADTSCYEMARVSLAYVRLQLGDHAGALEITNKVVQLGPGGIAPSTSTSPHLRGLAEMYHREAMTHA